MQTRSREEIYTHPYSKIRFRQHSNTVAAADLKLPPSMILNLANPILRIWDAYLRPECLHSKVNQTIRDLMQREDENTSYNNLASVNQALQLTAVYFADGEDSEGVAKHRDKLQIYVWQGAEGMTVSGTDGVQVWVGFFPQFHFRAVFSGIVYHVLRALLERHDPTLTKEWKD